MTGWRTYSLDQVHVVPAEDQTAHDMTGLDCICGPDVEFHERPLVMHHSLDGRP